MKNTNFKKLFNKKIKYSLVTFIKESIIISKYILKLLLVYTIKMVKKIIPYTFIKKNIPYRIKLKIKSQLLYYPKLTNFLRAIHFWIKNIETPKETFYSEYLLPLFIHKVGLPILELMLNNEPWKKITLDKSKKTPHLHIKFKQLLKDEKCIITQPNSIAALSYVEENAELTCTAQEIYRDLKMAITRHQINY